MGNPVEIPPLVLDKFRDAAVKVQSITGSESIGFDIEGVVVRVDEQWHLGMIPGVAVTAAGDGDGVPKLAVLEFRSWTTTH